MRLQTDPRVPGHRARTFIFLCASVAFLGLLGCGENTAVRTLTDDEVSWAQLAPATDTRDTNRIESKTFELNGRKGGKFFFRHLSLHFPPRAVEGYHRLTISVPDPHVAVWDLHLEPDVAFSKPVRLSVDYSGFSDSRTHLLLWYDEHAGVWVDLGGHDNQRNKTISVDLEHLSRYGVSDGTSGWGDGTAGWD